MNRSLDRYRQVGLAANPFAVQIHDGDAALDIGPWFVDRGIPDPPSPGSGVLVQVIGDQGMGKSTHLAHWRKRHPGPYHYIPRRPYRQRWHSPPLSPLVYGDEIDRMPVWLRRRWFRRLGQMTATVVIGTHADLSRVARRAGLAVRSHELTPVSADELAEVLSRRLQAAAVGDHLPAFRFTEAELQQILVESHGNLRTVDSVCHRILADRLRS